MQHHLAHLFPTPEGICLAGATIVTRHADGMFKTSETSLQANLQAAYAKPVTSQALRYVMRGCELLANVSPAELQRIAHPPYPPITGQEYSDLSKALMMFALSGLGNIDDLEAGKARLLKLKQTELHKGDALSSSGFTPADIELINEMETNDAIGEILESGHSGTEAIGSMGGIGGDADFEFQHPRWPAGSEDGTGGQFRPKDGSDGEYEVASSGEIMSDVMVDNTPATPTTAPAADRTLSNDGVNFIAQHEAFRARVYQDNAGYDTIGYGHRVIDGETYPNSITQVQGAELLAQDTATAQAAVRNNVTANLTQEQFDALTSFAYNVGATNFANSTLVQHINDGNNAAAAEQFDRWIHSTNQQGQRFVNRGLVNRRTAERDLFENGNY